MVQKHSGQSEVMHDDPYMYIWNYDNKSIKGRVKEMMTKSVKS